MRLRSRRVLRRKIQELDPDNQSDDIAPSDEETQQPPQKRTRGTHSGPLRKIKWGCFTIARKRISDVESAFECRCRFHRLNTTTKCKRTIGFTEDTEQHCLMVAKWWCNQALHYRKQEHHRGCFTDVLEVPYQPDEVLAEGMITEPPTSPVKTDAEIHLADALAPRAVGRGRSRGRGRGRAAGRGRGAARNREVEAAEASDSSQMASCSSSSGSST